MTDFHKKPQKFWLYIVDEELSWSVSVFQIVNDIRHFNDERVLKLTEKPMQVVVKVLKLQDKYILNGNMNKRRGRIL